MSVICVCHTSSYLHTHIFTYYIFLCTSSHTHIFTLTHTHLYIFSLSLSHTYIFTSSLTSSHSHLHILTSSLSLFRTHIFTYSHLLSLFSFLSPFSLSFLSPFSLSRLLYLSLFRPRVVPARSHETSTLSHEMRVDAQKLRSNCDFTCAGLVPEQPFRTKWGSMRKNWGKIAILLVPDLSRSNPFARNEGRSSKTEEKLRVYLSWSNPFQWNDGRWSKTE